MSGCQTRRGLVPSQEQISKLCEEFLLQLHIGDSHAGSPLKAAPAPFNVEQLLQHADTEWLESQGGLIVIAIVNSLEATAGTTVSSSDSDFDHQQQIRLGIDMYSSGLNTICRMQTNTSGCHRAGSLRASMPFLHVAMAWLFTIFHPECRTSAALQHHLYCRLDWIALAHCLTIVRHQAGDPDNVPHDVNYNPSLPEDSYLKASNWTGCYYRALVCGSDVGAEDGVYDGKAVFWHRLCRVNSLGRSIALFSKAMDWDKSSRRFVVICGGSEAQTKA